MMGYTNSELATFTLISPNKTKKRVGPIKGVAIHCTAGRAKSTAAEIAAVFQDKKVKASCNYAVGGDGSIALVVPEESRSWCTSSAAVDDYAVTIEVASDTSGLVVEKEALFSLNKLLTDICIRNGINELKWTGRKADACNWDVNNMQVHRWFSNKSCPGSFLFGMHAQIASEVNTMIRQQKGERYMTEADIRLIAEKVFTARLAYLTKDELESLFSKFVIREKKIDCPKWANESWEKAAEKGILDGTRPEGYLKRDELAVVLDRLNLLKKEE